MTATADLCSFIHINFSEIATTFSSLDCFGCHPPNSRTRSSRCFLAVVFWCTYLASYFCCLQTVCKLNSRTGSILPHRAVGNERNLVHLMEKSVEIKLKSWEIKADFLEIKPGNQPNPPAPPTFTTYDVIFEGNHGEIKEKSGISYAKIARCRPLVPHPHVGSYQHPVLTNVPTALLSLQSILISFHTQQVCNDWPWVHENISYGWSKLFGQLIFMCSCRQGSRYFV